MHTNDKFIRNEEEKKELIVVPNKRLLFIRLLTENDVSISSAKGHLSMVDTLQKCIRPLRRRRRRNRPFTLLGQVCSLPLKDSLIVDEEKEKTKFSSVSSQTIRAKKWTSTCCIKWETIKDGRKTNPHQFEKSSLIFYSVDCLHLTWCPVLITDQLMQSFYVNKIS